MKNIGGGRIAEEEILSAEEARRWRKPRQGNVCSYCGRLIRELPYRCYRCGEYFCLVHHLPEVHECKGLLPRSWDTYREERAKREPVWPVRTPPTWVPPPREPKRLPSRSWSAPREAPPPGWSAHWEERAKREPVGPVKKSSSDVSAPILEKTEVFAIIVVVGLIVLAILIPWVGTFVTTPSKVPPPTTTIATTTALTTTPSTTTTTLIPTTSSPPGTPASQVLPPGYYDEARKTYGELSVHDIRSLYNVLMSESCKMPSYDFNVFNCSTASARLEWVLEGYGFRTRLYMSSFYQHTWVMVELDDGSWVAIESVYLTSGIYYPPAIIEGPNGEYREYSFLYQMYRDYLRQYGGGSYILPGSYDEFLSKLHPVDSFNPLLGLNYYSGTEFYESLEDAVRPGLHYYSITGFDWWNEPPYNSMEPFNEWD